MRNFLILYFLFSFFFFSFFASGFVDSQDGLQYLTIARRIYYDHTFEMPSESFSTDSNIYMSIQNGKDGKTYAITGLGFSLVLLPAVVIEDIFLKISNVSPLTAFPLQNDWPVLLFASMTNAFFGALLVIGIYKYLMSLKLTHAQATVLSFLSVITTNLWIYTKHSFPHMLFTSFLLWSFYFMRIAMIKNSNLKIFLSGICLGIVVISYNQTYIFTFPAIFIYFLFLSYVNKKSTNQILLKQMIVKGFIFLSAVIPFIIINFLFNSFRMQVSETAVLTSAFKSILLTIPKPYIIIEGLWGLLFSPGKSIFLFSPPLLVLIFFWFKFNKKILPELTAFFILFFTYLWFIGTYMGGADFPVWHGDSSWGPRYIVSVIPFLMILVSVIIIKLTKWQKLFVVLPLFLIGLFVNFLGIVLPYQIRFAGLEQNVMINDRRFNVSEYGNEIPRYSPILKLSKTLFKRIKRIDDVYNHGKYDLHLLDGFDYPFDLGWTYWRGVKPISVIQFNNQLNDINSISIQFRNHQIEQTSSISAKLNFFLNGKNISDKPEIIKINEEKEIALKINNQLLQKNNIIEVYSKYENDSTNFLKNKQAIFLQFLKINDVNQNILTMDYPYVSPISRNLINKTYRYWGNAQKDPWEIWHMHSGVYEQTFDLWWLRPLHYWDMPKTLYFVLFLINVSSIIYFGNSIFLSIKNSNK